MAARIEAFDYVSLLEVDLLRLARDGDGAAFGALMQRCNQRLFRIARGVVRDESEAEDVLQEAYVRAFAALDSFRGEASVVTWLTRIVLNEARGRLRKRRPTVDLDAFAASEGAPGRILAFPGGAVLEDPEGATARAEARRLLERAVDQLPDHFRSVFILRDIEDCSVEETAACLDLKPQTVKTRLHRARRMLQLALREQFGLAAGEAFPFLGTRCERITAAVLTRLGLAPGDHPTGVRR